MKNIKEKISEANQQAVDRIISAQPILIDIKPALDIVPDMNKVTILHAGPPIEWERMCGSMRGSVIGALIYEGLAKNPSEAERLAGSGSIEFSPCHHRNAVGPMTGIISASMPVFVVKNETYGNEAYATLNEGLGKVLRYGAYSNDVIRRLKWIEKTLATALQVALKQSGGINLKNITAQALQMGDEGHGRNVAATLIFLKEIAPLLLKTDLAKETISEVVEFISQNAIFYLNLSMASCKATMDAAHGIKYSTIVTAMARNGVDIGIRVSGLGDKWFTTQAAPVKGLYFPGYSEKDANPDLGDSSIAETAGIGGFAMAAAPAMAQFIGGNVTYAMNCTREMMEITFNKNKGFGIPLLDYEGAPTGIDIKKVVETGVTPIINTGIAHKEPGIGQIGGGITTAPLQMFKQALRTMAQELGL